jgi:hypothetical protein
MVQHAQTGVMIGAGHSGGRAPAPPEIALPVPVAKDDVHCRNGRQDFDPGNGVLARWNMSHAFRSCVTAVGHLPPTLGLTSLPTGLNPYRECTRNRILSCRFGMLLSCGYRPVHRLNPVVKVTLEKSFLLCHLRPAFKQRPCDED